MILIPVFALMLLVESLLLVALGASAATARLGGDRRLAVEATVALETALARARIDHAATIAALPDGSSADLPVVLVAGWNAVVTAHREAGSEVIRLVAGVELTTSDGRPMAASTGTLLLQSVAADTAIVTAERPRF